VGEELLLVPSGEMVKIAVIYPDYGSPRTVREALPGENVRMILDKGQGTSARRGTLLCHPERPVSVCDNFVGEIQLLKLPVSSPVFSAGFKSIIHLHTEVVECEITEIICELDKNGKRSKLKKTICSIWCSSCCENPTSKTCGNGCLFCFQSSWEVYIEGGRGYSCFWESCQVLSSKH